MITNRSEVIYYCSELLEYSNVVNVYFSDGMVFISAKRRFDNAFART